MNSFKTNRHYNFIAGYPKEYYEYFFQNRLEPADEYLIELSRLFKGINGAVDPYEEALKYANYLLENGPNLLPSSIMYFVERFETLPDDVQEYVLENTPVDNNYFRKDNGSDKIGFLARANDARSNSSSIHTDKNQTPSLVVSEYLANKLPPISLRNIVELSYLTEQIEKGSQPAQAEPEKYDKALQEGHNDWKNITPTKRHVEAAEIAKPLIEARTYERFKDMYRVMHDYLFMHRPYDKKHRLDLTTENLIDTNPDIVAPGKAVVYTVAGDLIKKNTQTPTDLYSIEPRERGQDLAFTGSGPIGGSSGPEENKLNATGGNNPVRTLLSKLTSNRKKKT